MRPFIPTLLSAFATASLVLGGGDDKPSAVKAPVAPARKSAAGPAPPFTVEREREAMVFVRLHHPELATVLEVLKPMDPVEYRKAVGELSQVARSLADLQVRNPRRYEFALDTWKAKSRVELLAAQLAGAPSEERDSQLRTAIESRLDVEIRRHKSDLEQAEAAAKKAREAIDRLESRRDEIVAARLKSLQPKKSPKSLPASETKPATAANGGNRR